MRHPLTVLGLALALSFSADAQEAPRDPFFWLGEINKATADRKSVV